MRSLIAIAVAGLVLLPGAVAADELINNGLAPPNPANVIDDSSPSSTVYVRNVGCPPGWGEPEVGPTDPCPSPGAATRVAFADGGLRVSLIAKDSSSLTITGGAVSNSLDVNDSCTATMTGGSAVAAHFRQFSTFRMTGGSIGSNLAIYDSSILRMGGGVVEGRLIAYGSANVTIAGGTVETGLVAASNSTVTMNGGVVEGYVSSESNSSVTIAGGFVGEDLRAKHFSTTTIVGRHFAVDGHPVPYGDLTAETGTLTGALASGERIDNVFYQGGGSYTGTITLVESPGLPTLSPWSQLVLMAGLLGAGLGVRRWRGTSSSPAQS